MSIKLQNIYFDYASAKVLNNISFDLDSGKVLSIIGKSGSGKSTLLKCISSLLTPKYGKLFLNGQKYFDEQDWIYEPWELRQKIALVFQGYNLFPNFKVIDNISLALRVVRKKNKNEAASKAMEICSKLGINEILDKYPNEISGGQAQRVALARALVLAPPVLLLDEITSAIDPTTINNVAKVITELKNNEPTQATSVVMVTHNIKFAIEHSDFISYLDEGKLFDYLPANKFLKESTCINTLQFLEESKYYI